MRQIGVVTVARSDYGFYQPILRLIQKEPDISLALYVTGSHLSPDFGMTVDVIEQDGFTVDERVDMELSSDTPEGTANSMGLGTIGFGKVFARNQPDILLALGDRFEMLAAVTASLPFNIPVAHLHGGESTVGAIDDVIRHAITKMSHLHFVATETYARRVIQMGEDPWRVTVSGAPSLDNLKELRLLEQDELQDLVGLDLDSPFLLATYHPVSREPQHTKRYVSDFLGAVADSGLPVVFTYPGADPGSRSIIEMINRFTDDNDRAKVVTNLGTRGYFSMMKLAVAMVGNSSSGIVEAATFKLPAVDVGSRQEGRLRARNVVSVGSGRQDILKGIKKATSPSFRSGLSDLVNPYGDGNAAEIVVEKLKHVDLTVDILSKRFHDINL